jgi:hypothetical protein
MKVAAPDEAFDFETVFQARYRRVTRVIHDVYGPGKIVGVWSGPDRIYALYPSMQNVSREFILEVARSLE